MINYLISSFLVLYRNLVGSQGNDDNVYLYFGDVCALTDKNLLQILLRPIHLFCCITLKL